MNRQHVSSGSEFESKIGYSRAVVDGEYVFVSGTTVMITRLCQYLATH